MLKVIIIINHFCLCVFPSFTLFNSPLVFGNRLTLECFKHRFDISRNPSKLKPYNFFQFQMPLFGKSHKSPPDIIRNLRDALMILEKSDKGDKKNEKAVEEVNRWLQAVKLIIYGQDNQEPNIESVSPSSILSNNNANLFRLLNSRKKHILRIFCRFLFTTFSNLISNQRKMWH